MAFDWNDFQHFNFLHDFKFVSISSFFFILPGFYIFYYIILYSINLFVNFINKRQANNSKILLTSNLATQIFWQLIEDFGLQEGGGVWQHWPKSVSCSAKLVVNWVRQRTTWRRIGWIRRRGRWRAEGRRGEGKRGEARRGEVRFWWSIRWSIGIDRDWLNEN